MLDHLNVIVTFIIDAFLHTWPYLLLTIPLAVALRVTDGSRYVRKAFVAQPLLAIVLATLVGAISPFCSCGVIPIITSLLIAGVPLGPVMAFWIASPSMDPEIFFLSVSMLGPELAVARMVGTLVLSMSAGLIAYSLEQRGYFHDGLLRSQKRTVRFSWRKLAGTVLASVAVPPQFMPQRLALATVAPITLAVTPTIAAESPASAASSCATICSVAKPTLRQRVSRATLDTTLMVGKFMLLAFFLEALITLYVPETLIVGLLGEANPFAIVTAGAVGLPMYTSNLTALPLVGGLLEQGMLPGAALAFLIAGPTTTIPAMAAVSGIAKPKVFGLYVLIALVGAVVIGYGYQAFLAL